MSAAETWQVARRTGAAGHFSAEEIAAIRLRAQAGEALCDVARDLGCSLRAVKRHSGLQFEKRESAVRQRQQRKTREVNPASYNHRPICYVNGCIRPRAGDSKFCELHVPGTAAIREGAIAPAPMSRLMAGR